MSNDGPEFTALGELEGVLVHLSEELASWRRRALKAEQRPELGVATDVVGARERVVELEDENQELRERLDSARQRVVDLLSRLQFLEEQVAMEASSK